MAEVDRIKTDNLLKILGTSPDSLKIGKGKIIFISGGALSGKTTLARRVLRHAPQFKALNAGDFFREEAKRRGISIGEFMKASNKELMELDKAVDSKMIRHLVETDENLVFVGRMASVWAEVLKALGKPSLSIFLMVGRSGMMNRMAGRAFRKPLSRLKENELGALEKEMKRDEKDTARYKSLYGLNPFSFCKYATVIDTSRISEKETWSRARLLVDAYLAGN